MASAASVWIGIDWSPPSPRFMVHDSAGHITASGTLAVPAVAALPDQLAPYLPDGQTTPVICAGLRGLAATSLTAVPTVPLPGLLRLDSTDQRVILLAVPSLRQAKPVDLMQGCETAIAGFLAHEPDFDGVICSIAQHSTWAQISAKEVVSFQSHLTPLLATRLTPPIIGDAEDPGQLDEPMFDAALDAIMARPQNLGATLAGVSADAELNGVARAASWSKIMGALIGMELGGARPYWLGQRVAVIADGAMQPLYARALSNQGCVAQLLDRDAMVMAGLRAAHALWLEYDGQAH